MIRAVAFCPAAPVLIPDIAGSAASELDELRAACRAAITRAAAPGRRWIVLATGDASCFFAEISRGTFAGLGLPLEVSLGSDDAGPVELPLALTVGAWLLRDALGPACGAHGWAIASEHDPLFLDWADGAYVDGRDFSLLVIGDGSARRGVKAPGYLDDRAAAFDAGIGRALALGDPDALAALDPVLGDLLLAAGVPVWRVVGSSVAGHRWDARLLHTCAPYGVAYFAAVWTARG